MKMYKLEHPGNLLSRMFMLEYMKDLDTRMMYDKADRHQKELFFYRFTAENSKGEIEFEDIDINWSFGLFDATLYQLEKFMQLFLEEIAVVEEKRTKEYKKAVDNQISEEVSKQVDINIMDLAQADIKAKNVLK